MTLGSRPTGGWFRLKRDNDLYVLEIGTNKTTRLTKDSTETIWNARLDWVYPEELELGRAHWWSPDSRQIAFLQFDVAREWISTRMRHSAP